MIKYYRGRGFEKGEGRWGQKKQLHVNHKTRGVMVKAMNCGIAVREFVLQSRYYVHFRANTLGKSMNTLILPAK